MALPTAGNPISLSQIAAEFGGTTPHSLSEYYGVEGSLPTSGTISFHDFYGLSAGPVADNSAEALFDNPTVSTASIAWPTNVSEFNPTESVVTLASVAVNSDYYDMDNIIVDNEPEENLLQRTSSEYVNIFHDATNSIYSNMFIDFLTLADADTASPTLTRIKCVKVNGVSEITGLSAPPRTFRSVFLDANTIAFHATYFEVSYVGVITIDATTRECTITDYIQADNFSEASQTNYWARPTAGKLAFRGNGIAKLTSTKFVIGNPGGGTDHSSASHIIDASTVTALTVDNAQATVSNYANTTSYDASDMIVKECLDGSGVITYGTHGTSFTSTNARIGDIAHIATDGTVTTLLSQANGSDPLTVAADYGESMVALTATTFKVFATRSADDVLWSWDSTTAPVPSDIPTYAPIYGPTGDGGESPRYAIKLDDSRYAYLSGDQKGIHFVKVYDDYRVLLQGDAPVDLGVNDDDASPYQFIAPAIYIVADSVIAVPFYDTGGTNGRARSSLGLKIVRASAPANANVTPSTNNLYESPTVVVSAQLSAPTTAQEFT